MNGSDRIKIMEFTQEAELKVQELKIGDNMKEAILQIMEESFKSGVLYGKGAE